VAQAHPNCRLNNLSGVSDQFRGRKVAEKTCGPLRPGMAAIAPRLNKTGDAPMVKKAAFDPDCPRPGARMLGSKSQLGCSGNEQKGAADTQGRA
jgi:hypothetical protein